MQLGIDACGEVAGQQLCGSALTSLLPFNVVDNTFSMAGVCSVLREAQDAGVAPMGSTLPSAVESDNKTMHRK